MLPFDDITNYIPASESSSTSTEAINDNLTSFQAKVEKRQNELTQLNGLTETYVNDLQQTANELEEQKGSIDETLTSINSNLESILDAQNEQLRAIRNQASVAQPTNIDSITNNSQNFTNSSTNSATTNVNDFVSSIESIESMTNTIVESISNQTNSQASVQSRTESNSNGGLTIVNNFEADAPTEPRSEVPTNNAGATNSLERELSAMAQTFSTVTSNVQNNPVNNTTNSNLHINNSALNSVVNDIENGGISVDRTEIENVVNNSSNTNTSITNLSTAITNSISAALAQHDQKLIELFTSMRTESVKTESRTTEISNVRNETNSTLGVQNNTDQAEINHLELSSSLAAISQHLMTMTALLSNLVRKTNSPW